MRIHVAPIVALVGVALTPVVGRAAPITAESMPAALTSVADSAYAPLFDASGDLILLLAGFSSFEPPGTRDKLRHGSEHGGIVFSPMGGSWLGPWPGFGGNPWSGSSGDGQSPPGPGSFTLLSFSTPNQENAGPNFAVPFTPLTFGFESGPPLSLESCCEEDATAVPEPSMLVLLAGGVVIGLRRATARRSRTCGAPTGSCGAPTKSLRA